MDQPSIRQLTRRVEPLALTDTVGKAVDTVRRSPVGATPVVDRDAVVGMVSERDLLRLLPLSASVTDEHPAESTRTAPVESVMARDVVLLPDWYSLQQTAKLMEARSFETMAVVDERGSYLGVISRSDLIESLGNALRPFAVGGMATPLGVYLHTGNHRAGAGDLGLLLTGGTLWLLFQGGHWLVFAVLFALDEMAGWHLSEMFLSPFVAAPQWLYWLFRVLKGTAFLLLIRSIPLAGYHAAEHQVVHTVERGYRLDLDIVRAMPRPHPRCGTNLAVFLALLLLLTESLLGRVALSAGSSEELVAAALLGALMIMLTLLLWQFVGMKVQQHFTTRPASDKQLRDGMEAARQILDRYHRETTHRAPWWRRVWHVGLLQVVAGFACTMGVSQLLAKWIDLSMLL